VRCSVLCVFLVLLTILPLLASHQKSTDAERDGFKGAVKSVSTKTVILNPQPRQPDNGFAVVDPISCEVCDYDEEGNSIRRGQNWATGFVGGTTRYVRDEDEKVRQRIEENEKGELASRVMIGQFGKTEEEVYQHGVLQSRNEYRYDQNGNMIEWLTFDADGAQTASTTATFDQQGNVTEQFDRGPDGSFLLHFTQSFDADTDAQSFTNYNEDGTVRLTFTAKANKITNYWQQPSDEREYGSQFCFTDEPKQGECETHNPDGTIWRTVAIFADEKKRNPTRAELRDNDNQVQMAADYEYEFDERGNWTKCSVWTWTRESGERKLHETDSRTLTYWK
jgi:hypothetical protein